jgi:hypothetical protein
MDRLTRKTNGKDYCTHCRYIEKTNELFGRGEKPLAPNEYYKQEPYKIEDSYYDEDILVKLGKLEDLEEEIGCPLEVVFRALNEGIFVKDEELEKWGVFDRPRLYYSDDFKCYRFELGYGIGYVKIKDYQKTWWLKGEREGVKNNDYSKNIISHNS